MKLMTWFRDAPIKRKLMLIGLLSSGLALLFFSLILTARGWVEWRDQTITNMRTYADIVGANAAPAIMFDNQDAATETLSALSANPDIVDAMIYDKEGRMFARFIVPQHLSTTLDPVIKPGSYLFKPNQLMVSEQIRFKGEVVGSISLESDLSRFYTDILRDIALTFIAALGVFLASIFLFARLQKAIVSPILKLSDGMRKVSAEQDYSVRVAVYGKDEIGLLAHTFNKMLEHIQLRDAELAQHREHLEQEVASRTARLTEAQRIAHLGNWEWDVINNRLDWSDEIYRIFGLTPQQFGATYETFLQAVHTEDRELVDTRVREALESGHPYSMDHRILHPDGSVRHVHEQAEVFRNQDGQPVKMRGTVQDITEAKLAEKNLLLFRKLLEKSNDAIFINDTKTSLILDVNERALKNLGYTREELMRMRVTDIEASLPEQFSWEKHMKELDAAGFMLIEGRHRRKDGVVFPVEISVINIQVEEERFNLTVVRDITERKRAAQALEESERKFRAILDSAVDGILVADGQSHKFVTANRSICDMLGYTLEEMYQLGMEDIHPAEKLAEVQEGFELQLKGEMRMAPDLPVKRKDGSVFFADVSASPMVLAGRSFLVGVFHDVSERKLAEEKIRQMNEELEARVQERTRQLQEAQEELVRREKLAVLGQVAGSVGHELRNPLSVMSNAVYFLQTVLTDADETTLEYLNIIKDEIADSERIVSDLLDSVRTKPPNPEAVGLAELIAQTLRKCSVPPSVTVQLNLPAMLPALRVDPLQIHQVFRNLISNGIEAMPDGGTLQIGAIENAQEQTITIRVQDTGIGMTPEQLGHLFQPLFTTKARGIGLGLVVVKNLTKANGGSIAVQSAPGHGTTFTVTLPAENVGRDLSRHVGLKPDLQMGE